MTQNVVGIRFTKIGKTYHFRAQNITDIRTGDYAVVETSRGQQLGEVVQIVDEQTLDRKGYLKPILRVATPQDLVLRQVWEYKEKEAVETCRSKINELNIQGVKVISSEYTFDGKRLTFMYNVEGDDSVDLSELRSALKKLFRRTRIDLRQIGPRDAAKIIGGMGVCGMGVRCCSMFLTEFEPISIRMAKAQGVSLAPTEITGMCGRLRCCLKYEYGTYVEARKELPREKRRIKTPLGEGKVTSVSPLLKKITVRLEEGVMKEFTLDELQGKTPSTEEGEPEPDPDLDTRSKNKRKRSKRSKSRRKKKRRR
jgi:cell fate regulator YaaT (PSP1 superfamily)